MNGANSQIIKIFHWPQLALFRQNALLLELVDCLGVKGVAVYIDHARRNGVS
jgi:hypothetical protein